MNRPSANPTDLGSVVRILRPGDAKTMRARPGQIDVRISFDPTIAEKISLFLKGGSKVVRFDVGKPWSWSDTFKTYDESLKGGPIPGDRPEALLLEVRITLGGETPATSAHAKRFVEALDLTEQDADNDIAALVRSRVDETWRKICEGRGRRIAELLTRDEWRRKLEAELCEALNREGLGLRSVRIASFGHKQSALDFHSGATPLKVRCRDARIEREFHYNVRLTWGTALRHVAARSLYLGSLYKPRPAGEKQPAEDALGGMREPLVPGQFEPLEGWFEHLLGEAMRARGWGELQAEIAAGSPAIIAELSELLGTGTGRCIETLSVKHVPGADAPPTSKTFKFSHDYQIVGLNQRLLTIEHDVKYHIEDRDIWESERSPAEEPKLREIIVRATENALHQWNFGKIIDSYRDLRAGDKALSADIVKSVGEQPAHFGFSLEALSSVGVLRDRAFIAGQKLELPLKEYTFADASLTVELEVRATVSVGGKEEDHDRFVRAIQAGEAIEARVAERLERSVREHLRKSWPYQYFTSTFGTAVSSRGRSSGEAIESDPFREEVRRGVSEDLAREFGLRVDMLDLISSKNDPYIKRMNSLKSRDIELNKFYLEFSSAPSSIIVDTRVKVEGISPPHWTSFEAEVERSSEEQHYKLIVKRIQDGMTTFESMLSRGNEGGLTEEAIRTRVQQQIIDKIEIECGLKVAFSNFVVRVEPNGIDIIRNHIENNKQHIQQLLNDRLDRSNDIYGEKDDLITKRIDKLKDETAELERQVAAMPSRTISLFHNERPSLQGPAASIGLPDPEESKGGVEAALADAMANARPDETDDPAAAETRSD